MRHRRAILAFVAFLAFGSLYLRWPEDFFLLSAATCLALTWYWLSEPFAQERR